VALMRPGQPLYRAASWMARGDNAFHVLLWTLGPVLLAITVGAFF
jgi:hypothetical protein